MSTHIHVSGLSYFCSDEELRQAFTPYGRVVLAHVLRDEWGHSLGLGVVHMASSEDVERVFNAHQRIEVSGSRVDLWEPADAETQTHRACDERDERIARAGRGTGHVTNSTALHPYALLMRRLIQTLVSSSRTVERWRPDNRRPVRDGRRDRV